MNRVAVAEVTSSQTSYPKTKDAVETVKAVEQVELEEPPLPPDGGWGWAVMIASFFINFIVDGVCYTFGIINVELQNTFSEATKAETALVGSLVPAVYLMVGPFVSILSNRFGCRLITIIGSIIAAVFFFISSFSNSITMMMFTYGVMGGVGFGLMYLPSIVIVGYYFDKYRALATGVAVCGSGIGTFVLAPLATYLVEEYSWRGCNIIISGIIVNGIAFGAVFFPLYVRRTNSKSHIIEKIKLEKQRNRTLSETSTHDGAVITNDNRVVLRHPSNQNREKGEDRADPVTRLLPGLDVSGPPNQNRNSRSSNHIGSKTSMTVGSRMSIRSGNKGEVVHVLERQDALYLGSIKNLPEYKLAGSHPDYVRSVLEVNESEVNESKWEELKKKALKIFDFTLLTNLTFVVLCGSGVLVFIGLYTPFVYLQQRAVEMGASRDASNFLILFLGLFNTISRIVSGALADCKWIDCLVIHNVGAIVAGVATCFVPLLNSYILLCLYAAIFGISIASFIALRSIVFVELMGLKKLNNAFGLTSLFQGIAVLIGSPISGALIDKTGSFTVSFLVCGVLIILGGVICLPVRRIATWENKNASKTKFREVNGFENQYNQCDNDIENGNGPKPRV